MSREYWAVVDKHGSADLRIYLSEAVAELMCGEMNGGWPVDAYRVVKVRVEVVEE